MKRAKKLGALLLVMALVLCELPAGFVEAAAKKAVVVTTKKELKKALKDGKVKKITVKINGNVTIPKGNYGKKELVVNSEKAAVKNGGKFKKITISDAKMYKEAAKGNDINITDKKVTVSVMSNGAVGNITVARKNASVTVKVDGTLDTLNINKKAAVSVEGQTEETIAVNNNAAGTSVTVSASVELTNNKAATVNFEAGSDGSTVTAKADISVNVAKETSISEVVLEKSGIKADITADGGLSKVTVAQTADITISGSSNESKIAVSVEDSAAGTKVEAATAVEVTSKADTEIDLKAGAEGSSVKADSEGVKTSVNNGTTEKVVVSTPTGNKEVGADKSETVTNPTKNPTPTAQPTAAPTAAPGGSGSSGGGSSSGGSSSGGSSSGGSSSGGGNSGTETPSTPDLKPVTAISLDKTGTQYIKEGETLNLTLSYAPGDAATKAAVWSSGDTTKATVDGKDTGAVVTGVAQGSAVITAKYKDGDSVSDTITANVTVQVVTLSGITLSESTDTIAAGASADYNITYGTDSANYIHVANPSVSITKDDDEEAGSGIRAEISSDKGRITVFTDETLDTGEYNVSVSEEGETAELTITVEAKPENSVLVTFKNNDDVVVGTDYFSNNATTDYNTKKAVMDGKITAPTGYELKGWTNTKNSNTTVNFSVVFTEAVTLYPVFEAKKYDLTINKTNAANATVTVSGDGSEESEGNYKYTYSDNEADKITVQINAAEGEYLSSVTVKVGSGDGDELIDPSNPKPEVLDVEIGRFVAENQEITIVAKKYKTLTSIVWNGNSGQVASGGSTAASLTDTVSYSEKNATDSDTVTLPESVTRDGGYEFKGWAYESSSGEADFAANESIPVKDLLEKLASAETKSITLYAVWERNIDLLPSVSAITAIEPVSTDKYLNPVDGQFPNTYTEEDTVKWYATPTENQGVTVTKTVVDGGIDVTIDSNTSLKWYNSSVESQGKHCWVRLAIKTNLEGSALSGLKWQNNAYGTLDGLEEALTIDNSNKVVLVFSLKADELNSSDVERTIQIGEGKAFKLCFKKGENLNCTENNDGNTYDLKTQAEWESDNES